MSQTPIGTSAHESLHSDLTIPGSGWSNGAIAADLIQPEEKLFSLYSNTQSGKKELYSEQRRWIGLEGSGWTRLGESGHEHDRCTSSSSNLPKDNAATKNETATIDDVHEQAYAVRSLIAQLCETFYRMGWATGTGGGCSIRVSHPIDKGRWRVFVAPSGIQKEDMIGNDIFELDMDRDVVVPPKTKGLRQSACTPLWYVVYKYRPTATCVIHTHSMNAVQATLLDPTEQSTFVRITHLEMLKGVGNHGYDDYLDIPIIDNRPTEDLLASQLEDVIQKYPKCNAVLVRRHGIYCWGDTWEQAKTQCESFDYLFDCIIKMKLLNIDYSTIPPSGTYRKGEPAVQENGTNKKRKVEESSVSGATNKTNGFNGMEAVDNAIDCLSSPVPLLPRDHQKYKYILLDIEGCTTSISFVKDVLFPYAREHMKEYTETLAKGNLEKYKELFDALYGEGIKGKRDGNIDPYAFTGIEQVALYLMDQDRKSAPLKELQGVIWEEGYKNGTIQGHVYADIPVAFQWFQQHNISMGIYSSGSIQAQKLLFRNTKYGNLLSYIHNHFDITTSGSKMESTSYKNIARALQIPIEQICFVSDSIPELIAAKAAGMVATICSIRPGNVPLQPPIAFPTIHSLLQMCGAE
jgi:methylthioribulose 1-phosphate dehydratase / enolase-phosphatase E1